MACFVPKLIEIQATNANMATLPCFNSASRKFAASLFAVQWVSIWLSQTIHGTINDCIFAYMNGWLFFWINVGEYTIHGWHMRVRTLIH